MARRKTNEEFVREVYELVGDEYTFLEEYVNNRVKIKIAHNLCNHEYLVTPKGFLKGNRCIDCNPYRKRTTNEFREIVRQRVGSEYTVVSEYIGHHDPITVRHTLCGELYKVAPSDFLKGRRCKKCHFKGEMKTNQEWLSQVRELAGDDFVFLEEYKGDNVKLQYRHFCGREHEVTPNNFIFGTRCPHCQESSGEANVRRYLTENGLVFEKSKRFEGLVYEKPLSYDFYVPSCNILIEYQGIQHYEPVEVFGGETAFRLQVIKDNIKRKYSRDNRIELIEIPYTYDSYEKVEGLLDTTISSILQCNVTQGALNQK